MSFVAISAWFHATNECSTHGSVSTPLKVHRR